MRHRDRDILVRGDQRLWRRQPGMRRAGVSFDDRREIGAGIGEEIFDPALRQERQIRLGDAFGRDVLASHDNSLRRRCEERSDEAISIGVRIWHEIASLRSQ